MKLYFRMLSFSDDTTLYPKEGAANIPIVDKGMTYVWFLWDESRLLEDPPIKLNYIRYILKKIG